MVNHRPRTSKKRLDALLVDRGLVDSRQKAQAVILAGNVRVLGQRKDKAGALVAIDAAIEISGNEPRYASRGGIKLEGALEDFGVDPSGRICLDVGCSTGGFTDCLLQRGALRVYAADVTTSQLAWKLQSDARVVPIQTNARYLAPEMLTPEMLAPKQLAREKLALEGLAERPSLVTADLSFISVTKVLPRLVELAAPRADFLILVKPQFELERKDIGKGGIVRDPALHQRAVERVRLAAIACGLEALGVRPSKLAGAEGNQEFFLHARMDFGNSGSAQERLE